MLARKNKIIADLEIHQTSCRKEVVQVFVENAGIAFSESEIRKHLTGKYDRVTIYRTIKILTSRDFIHRVICDQGVPKYALTNYCNPQGEHAHFQCAECSTVFCLNKSIESISLPPSYVIQNKFLLIKGICEKCIQSRQVK